MTESLRSLLVTASAQKESNPVCGKFNGKKYTFGNPCMAECKQVTDYVKGPCEDKPSGDCICTKESNPVCGKLNGKKYTFGNPCMAECKQVTDVKGPCEDKPSGDCICTKSPILCAAN